MKLDEILKQYKDCQQCTGDCTKEIDYIYSDSRKSSKNDIFCLDETFGSRSIEFLHSAAENGCTVVMIYEGSPYLKIAKELFSTVIVCTRNPGILVGEIASLLAGQPSLKMKVIGVTGTNGKTSITHILYNLFIASGFKAGVIGTINVRYGDVIVDTGYTTPDSSTLNKILAEMAEHGVEYVFMEASSHGLNLGRLNGIHFQACLFTNLTQDHLDFHLTMEDYFKDKYKVFELLDHSLQENKFGLIALDAPGGKEMLAKAKSGIRSTLYSLGSNGDFQLGDIKLTVRDSIFTLKNNTFHRQFATSLLGNFNVTNVSMAIITALHLGLSLDIIEDKIKDLGTVPGRFQILYNHDHSKTVIVDYAHTPDALENILQSINEIQQENVYTLFGCGGDRDRTKRPLMAAIAEKYSSTVILTSDNPRTEDPESILDEIEKGFVLGKYHRIADRRAAIIHAVQTMPAGGVLLVAGKGHEEYQIIGREKFRFSDVEEVQKAFALIDSNR